MIWHHIDIAEHGIKEPVQLHFLFLRNTLQKVWFIRIKKQVGEKRDTVGTYSNNDCLLKSTSTKPKNIYPQSITEAFSFLPFCWVFYVRQAIKSAARDLVLHGIVSQSNRPSIINNQFYDCCSNINCRISRSKKASNINFTWIPLIDLMRF